MSSLPRDVPSAADEEKHMAITLKIRHRPSRCRSVSVVAGSLMAAALSLSFCHSEGRAYFADPDGQPVLQSGIFGTVTYLGQPVEGIELSLIKLNGGVSVIDTTTTDANGDYDFTGVPSAQPDEWYYVQYGPNSSDPNYVFYWYGPDIFDYVAGEAMPGGTFDIANIELASPAEGASLPLPVTFSWVKRSNPDDSYRWFLLDQSTGDRWFSLGLGYVSEYTLDTLPSGAQFGKTYGWHMSAFTTFDGYGLSHELRSITFVGTSSSPSPSPTQTRTPTPTMSPTASTTSPPSSYTPSPSPSVTAPTGSPSPSPTGTPIPPTDSATVTATGTGQPQVSATPSGSPSATGTSQVTPATGTASSPATATTGLPGTGTPQTITPTSTTTAVSSPTGSAPALDYHVYLPFTETHSAGRVMKSESD